MPAIDPNELLANLAKIESPQAARAQGQRQFQRFVARGEAILISMDRHAASESGIQVQIRDVSRGGLGFVSQERLEQGSTWRIAFLTSGHVVGTQGMIVRHCRELQPGTFYVGGQFCIESGLMCLLGIDPAIIREGDQIKDTGPAPRFLTPGEVA